MYEMNYNLFIILLFALFRILYANSNDYLFVTDEELTPVVIWHGMGDSCCNPLSMSYIKKLIQTNIPGIYVYSVMLGNNIAEDIEKGFFSNMNEQIQIVCEILKKDQNLINGYNAIGFSQGGLFMRAIAQRCPYPPIKNLISIGGPQQGVFGIVQAQFWHDPTRIEDYRNKNIFLPELNCEIKCNSTYKKNMLKLQNFVLVQFLKDEEIQPKESAWFGFYSENDTEKIIPMEQTNLYKQDLIGLKTLEKTGRLHFLSINGKHLHITSGIFTAEIINKYLKTETKLSSNEFEEEDDLY
ncbi:hypothetical protein Mgra_00002702 [Meloidogyne graminicola]|uniref:Palmitoyl-protein thioesterase 1 n=1 Tax=Meloidogyne graminicola TaxID=189291 RepID=A0A8S9ZWN7_9BILA|nr:hypothetical protein Mgra_00002702 [Meloidogyne graminicola]